MIRLKYTLNSDDYQKLMGINASNKKNGYLAVIVVFMITLTSFVISKVLNIPWSEISKILYPLFGILLGGIAGLILTLILQKQLIIRNSDNPINTATMEVQADDSHLTFINQYGLTKYFWNCFCESKETGEHFILEHMTARNNYILIPKRGFDSAADMDEFRSLLKAKIGSMNVLISEKRTTSKSQLIIVLILLFIALVSMFLMELGKYHR